MLDPLLQFELAAAGLTVTRGESVNITCPVIGYPAPKIIWMKDDKEISGTEDDHVKVVKGENRVQIVDIGIEQEGLYRCKARNTIQRDGVIEDHVVVLMRRLRVKGELAWVLPLIVIVVTLVLLVLIIVVCECKQKRDAEKEEIIAEQDNDDD